MTAQKRRAMLRAAEKLVARGKLDEAIKQYLKILRAQPDDTRTLNSVGDLYVRLNRLDEAVEIFSRAAEHFSVEGFFLKAIAILKKIIRLDPTRIGVYERLADLYHHQGLRNEALSQYQVVADYYSRSRDSAKELSIFERMVELAPGNLSHRVKLAELYRDVEEISAALDQYQVIASYMLEHGKPDEALTVYREALELCSDDLAFVSDVVLRLKGNGWEEEADRFLTRAIEKNPAAAQVKVAAGPIDTDRADSGDEVSAVAGPSVTAPAEDETSEAGEIPVPEDEDEQRREDHGAVQEASELVEGGGEGGEADALLDDAAETSDHGAEEREESIPVTADEFEIDLATLESAVAEDDAGVIAADAPDEVPSISDTAAVPEAAADSERDGIVEARPEVDRMEVGAGEGEGEIAQPVAEVPEEVEWAAADSASRRTGEGRADERLSEARMLLSYGLSHKAVRLFEQVLADSPDNSEAHESLIGLLQEEGNFEAVAEAAWRARQALEEDVAAWMGIEHRLHEWGYVVSGEGIQPPPAVDSGVETAEAGSEPVSVEPSEPIWLAEEEIADSGPPQGEEIFGAEAEFFDLAAELEKELSEEVQEIDPDEIFPRLEEQSLEEIVEGLKQGVAETLSDEDFETHYNLGIAYREMGLVDEAIGEFQLAAKSPEFFVDCCSLLGSCFLEKGFPDLAIKWYERGLGSPRVSEMESLGLLYELGNLYMITGEKDVARKTFAEIYGINSNYRDIVAKLEELRPA